MHVPTHGLRLTLPLPNNLGATFGNGYRRQGKMNEDEMEHISKKLEQVIKNLQELRNLRDEAGSKVIALDAYRRHLERQLDDLKND